MRVGSLFAGIGGFDLAARWMDWETAWFSEIDPYASAVLAKHWPGVPNHGDITKIDFRAVEPVDLLCGGFPCQDISNAGKRAGIDGERSGLWREYARAIGELQPRYVVVENVAALLGRGLGRVLGDLAALRYDAEWTVLSAAHVGAPQLRERLWIVAHPKGGAGDRGERSDLLRSLPSQCATRRHESKRGGEALAYPESLRLEGGGHESISDRQRSCQIQPVGGRSTRDGWRSTESRMGGSVNGIPASVDRWPSRPGERQHEWEPPRVAGGVANRKQRVHAIGNAIVPQCALVIFQAIQAREAVIRAA